jgi:hypothetical protein
VARTAATAWVMRRAAEAPAGPNIYAAVCNHPHASFATGSINGQHYLGIGGVS